MKPEDVYISPDAEVFVTNFELHYSDKLELKGIVDAMYHLEIGKWYKVGIKSIAPNADDFIDIIQSDGTHIPYFPRHFMSKMEWRQKQLSKLL